MATTNTSMTLKLEYGIFFFVYLVVLITTILFFVYADNSKSFSYTTLGFVLMTFFALGVTLYYYYPGMNGRPPNMTVVYLFAIIIVFVVIFSYVGAAIDAKNLKALGIVFIVILSGLLIVSLAFVFYIFGDYLKQRRGLVGLIINFIFYIPCMVLDFIEYMKREFSLTTRTEYILLAIETVLIICYFFARPIINSALAGKTVFLLKNPLFLNRQTILLNETSSLGVDKNSDLLSHNASVEYRAIPNSATNNDSPTTYEPVGEDTSSSTETPPSPDNSATTYSPDNSATTYSPDNSATTYSPDNSANTYAPKGAEDVDFYKIEPSMLVFNTNFSISMWVYLNIQTNSSAPMNEINVFDYGGGKPKISYINNPLDVKNRDMYNFYFTDSTSTPNYQASMPSQKWNNIVFNYSSQKVDLFVNGNLATTFYFDSANLMPNYSESDQIIVGEEKGLSGAICNIVYTKTNMLNNQIVNDYNILMLKSPPVPQI